MNATRPHSRFVNTDTGNGLVLSGIKPLPKPMLIQICRHSKNKIYFHFLSFLNIGMAGIEIRTGTCVSNIDNAIAADGLVTQGTTATAIIVLIYISLYTLGTTKVIWPSMYTQQRFYVQSRCAPGELRNQFSFSKFVNSLVRSSFFTISIQFRQYRENSASTNPVFTVKTVLNR